MSGALTVVELISGWAVQSFAAGAWADAYVVRDRAQEAALCSGFDLTERRYGLRHG